MICKYEGILGVKLTEKIFDYEFVLFGCYLPPDGSRWGYLSSSFFENLSSEIFLNCNVDNIIICGDLNSRIAGENDHICNIDDDIPKRKHLDEHKNSHGVELLSFFTRSKMYYS